MNSPSEVAQGAGALVATAIDALSRGDLDIAEVHCRQALSVEAGHIGALAVLGSVLHGLARFREAESLFAELTDRAPDTATFWTNLGTVRRASGKFDAALAAFTRAAELGDKSADFYFNLGLTHLERYDYEAARSVFALALSLAPADAEIRLEYARACEALGLEEEAISALLGLQDEGSIAPSLRARIAMQLLTLGEVKAAEQIAARLTAAGAPEPQAALTLVKVYERLNRVEDARSLLGRIKSDPRTLAQGVSVATIEARLLQRAGRHEEAVILLRKDLGLRRDAQLRQLDLFPLAQSLDALGRHEECFEALEEAHRCQLSNVRVSAQLASLQTARPLLMAQRNADSGDLARWVDESAPAAAASPVFVAGAPRSGKILIELMLDAHPQLVASEGRPLLQQVIAGWSAQGNIYPQALASLTPTQLGIAREKYWQAARRKLRLAPGQRVVDTDPMNLLQLPAIRRLFPNAPLVFVMRHPCDALFSIHMQSFPTAELAAMNANLQTLAFSYGHALDHWLRQCDLLAPQVHEVRYEEMVADFGATARELAAALELSWHDAMAKPDERAKSKGRLPTSSYAEAVQPISARSVGRWRRNAAQFSQVLPVLRPYATRWNYEI